STFSGCNWSFDEVETTSCGSEMVVRQNDEWGFAGKKLASAKKIIGEYILEMVSFRIEKNYILLYSEQSPTKIHT
ncbi:MAG TPA: hypothetical protein P5020_04360, partial [Dysgonamonadaceae bacterium]|nr:hypothetical protein [Dysgonamonadaceae bacterium]